MAAKAGDTAQRTITAHYPSPRLQGLCSHKYSGVAGGKQQEIRRTFLRKNWKGLLIPHFPKRETDNVITLLKELKYNYIIFPLL